MHPPVRLFVTFSKLSIFRLKTTATDTTTVAAQVVRTQHKQSKHEISPPFAPMPGSRWGIIVGSIVIRVILVLVFLVLLIMMLLLLFVPQLQISGGRVVDVVVIGSRLVLSFVVIAFPILFAEFP